MINHHQMVEESKLSIQLMKRIGKSSGSLVRRRNILKSTLVIIVTVLLVTPVVLSINRCWRLWPRSRTMQPPLFRPPTYSKEGFYRFAAVAADAEECSKIGTRIMARECGSAIDAAIATILCVGVHNSHSCGIGGGHFLTYYNRATRTAWSIIAREQAPAAATEDMFINNIDSSMFGGKAIGIPGEIRGLYEAHKLGGRLPWKYLFQPAIQLARDGFRVGKAHAKAINGQKERVKTNSRLRAILINPKTGKLYKHGEIMKHPALAKTLEIIAHEGPDAFYTGSLAADIVADIQEAGGIITEADLATYTAVVKSPLQFTMFDNNTVYSPPPPSSGAVYLMILNILNGYKFSPKSIQYIRTAGLTWHRIIEAFKHAFALRTILGDTDVGSESFKNYVQKFVANMTSADYGEFKRAAIDNTRTFEADYYNASFDVQWDLGTTHVSVLGPNGDAVSISSSINRYFGSGVIGSRTGIIFNSNMDDFSTPNTINFHKVPASPANFIAPWKRPMSSMCPSIIVSHDGDAKMNVGAAGGPMAITSTALVTMESLWFKWSIKQSIDYPRLHHQLFPNNVWLEKSFPQPIEERLRRLGHNVGYMTGRSMVHGIVKPGTYIRANSDFRKGGAPDGY